MSEQVLHTFACHRHIEARMSLNGNVHFVALDDPLPTF